MMHMKHYPYMFEEEPESRGFRTHPLDTHFVTSTTHAKHPGRYLTKLSQIDAIKDKINKKNQCSVKQ